MPAATAPRHARALPPAAPGWGPADLSEWVLRRAALLAAFHEEELVGSLDAARAAALRHGLRRCDTALQFLRTRPPARRVGAAYDPADPAPPADVPALSPDWHLYFSCPCRERRARPGRCSRCGRPLRLSE